MDFSKVGKSWIFRQNLQNSIVRHTLCVVFFCFVFFSFSVVQRVVFSWISCYGKTLKKEWPSVPNRPWVVKQFVEEFEYFAHGRLTNTPPVYIWMLSLGISRGFAFVDFYHLQDATRWMETNQVASQSPSLVLILGIWKEKKKIQKATKVLWKL